MILVDSSVWIDHLRGSESPQAELLNRLFGRAELLVGDLIVAEVLQGVRDDAQFNLVRKTLALFPRIEIVGLEVAVQAARNYRLLRSKGVTVRKTIDALIATRCIQDGIALLHSDRDFDPFALHLGLKVAFQPV